jgi:glutamate N-acetyltransferase/amino-acid N-acetyltransferase
MAVGKVFAHPVPLEALRISFGDPAAGLAISAASQSPETLARIADYLKGSELRLHLSVGAGPATETVWGCDLTEGYVRENAYYTT